MPTIFAGVKKKNQTVVGPSEEGPDENGQVLKALADSILQAIKDGNAENLAQALKSFHLECEDYAEED